MPVVISTLPHEIHPNVEKGLRELAQAVNTLHATVAALAKGGGTVSPAALNQIRQALSSTGSAPLTITGSLGPPAGSPSGVVPGTYGDAFHVPEVTVNASGVVTDIIAVPIVATGSVLEVLTVDPVAPADDTAWLFRDVSVTPNNLDLHVRKGGVTIPFPLGTYP